MSKDNKIHILKFQFCKKSGKNNCILKNKKKSIQFRKFKLTTLKNYIKKSIFKRDEKFIRIIR